MSIFKREKSAAKQNADVYGAVVENDVEPSRPSTAMTV